MIGVDGGGTKTEMILVDSAGNLVARHSAPGCNPNQVGADEAGRRLRAGLAALMDLVPAAAGRPPIARTLLCMAGAPTFWRELAATLPDCGAVETGPDSLPVLELATGGAPGLALHAGTGSFIAARAPDGSIHYAGGLGWKLGDPGSAFDVGRRAIARGLLELQGWAPATPLGDALMAHTGLVGNAEITRHFYASDNGNALVAGFAPRVTELAAAGCHPAQVALAESLAELAEQAGLVLARLFPPAKTGAADPRVPVGLSGALLNTAPAVAALHALAGNRGWRVAFHPVAEPPIEGVRRLLLALR